MSLEVDILPIAPDEQSTVEARRPDRRCRRRVVALRGAARLQHRRGEPVDCRLPRMAGRLVKVQNDNTAAIGGPRGSLVGAWSRTTCASRSWSRCARRTRTSSRPCIGAGLVDPAVIAARLTASAQSTTGPPSAPSLARFLGLNSSPTRTAARRVTTSRASRSGAVARRRCTAAAMRAGGHRRSRRRQGSPCQGRWRSRGVRAHVAPVIRRFRATTVRCPWHFVSMCVHSCPRARDVLHSPIQSTGQGFSARTTSSWRGDSNP